MSRFISPVNAFERILFLFRFNIGRASFWFNTITIMENISSSTSASRDTFAKACWSWIVTCFVTGFTTIRPNKWSRTNWKENLRLGIIQEMLIGTFVAICFRSPFQSHDICSIAFEVICIKNLANWFAAKISAPIIFEFVSVLISHISVLFKPHRTCDKFFPWIQAW